MEIKETLFKEFTIPDHFHNTYCIGLLSQGIKESIVEGNYSIVHSNSVTIVNPYQVHSDQNLSKDATRFRMLYINKDVLNFFAKKNYGKIDRNILFTNNLITDSLVSEAILNLFNQMSNENLLGNKLFNLIELILEKYQETNKDFKYNASLSAISDSVEYARLNFADKIDIAKMAMDCKLSKYQFIRYFNKLTGLTPASYMIVCRVNYAKSLLVKGFPIGQLALEAGFYDHAHFCKFFKFYTGISPTEYKKDCNIIQAED